MYYKNPKYRIFYFINSIFLIFISLLCIFPLIHILAVSFSSGAAASANLVSLWPVHFTWDAYQKTLGDNHFLLSIWNSSVRVGLGVTLGMMVTLLTAYPLSKIGAREMKGRVWMTWYFVFPMLFSGGLIPFYILVQKLGLINSIWVLILPGLAGTWNIILLINFLRALPRELEEASLVDGAGHFRTLISIYVPLSMPAIATLSLFVAVGHWNSWFDGLIFLSDKAKWPLSTLLQTLIVMPDPTKLQNNMDPRILENFSQQTVKAAQIFIGSLPILAVYPFLQRYFVKGIVIGAVKE
ncbi:putative aldouronate transport system permease protein [Paenibacillus castaneae]|uniref:carbohydrate ABC transporter permease n=1 Tax=Paenibacillus castaneae TaxID=474957 RepID=UPI000C9A1404|nr:carbohydrate ABC transporter permease [Paenibacillus castaneae]NIK78073.1 putative aldouronate transport system permease protein [Paenibacillus castaneae]